MILDERDDDLASVDMVSEKSAEGNDVAFMCDISINRAGLLAAAAVGALIHIDGNLAVLQSDGFLAACLYADAAVYALVFLPLNSFSALDADIISSVFRQLFWQPVTPNLNLPGSSLAKYRLSISSARP